MWTYQPAQPANNDFFTPGVEARWNYMDANGNGTFIPATGQFADPNRTPDLIPIGATPNAQYFKTSSGQTVMGSQGAGGFTISPVDPAQAQAAIAGDQSRQQQEVQSKTQPSPSIGGQFGEFMQGPGAVMALPFAVSGAQAAFGGMGAVPGAGGATTSLSDWAATQAADDAAFGAGAPGTGSAFSPIATDATGMAIRGAAGAAAGAAGAGAGAAASGLPSWLRALGPAVGIAAGANSLLNPTTATGTGNTASTGAMQTVAPGNLAAYQKLLGIDPSGYVASGNAAGMQYADLAKQMQAYQQMMEAQARNAGGAQTDLQAQGQREFGAGNAMQTRGMDIMGNAQPLINAGNAAWNTAQDPQSALYARTAQQLQDQSRAATSARGIGMSPEAAGIEGGTMSNFNIDWQNQQLARMLSGLSGMGGAYNAAAGQYGAGTSAFGAGTSAVNAGTGAYNAAGDYGKLFGADTAAAAGFGAQVPQATQMSGSVPFQTQQAAYGAPLQAGQDYASATNTAFNPNLANFNLGQAKFGADQSAAGMNALLTGIYGYNPNSPFAGMSGNQPGSWLSTAFGGQSGGSGSYNPFPNVGA